MIDGTKEEGVILQHEICGIVVVIPWDEVNVTGDFGGTYAEFTCPGCGARLAVYTKEPIKERFLNGKREEMRSVREML